MTQKEIIKSDVQKRLDNLIDFSSRRREWYQEQHLRVADRQSQQIALIASVSATILAIATVLPGHKVSLWANLSFALLLINVVLGIILVGWLVYFDKKVLNQDRNDELSILKALKSSTELVISNPTIEGYKKHIKSFNDEVNKIIQMPQKYQIEKIVLNIIYFLVLSTFLGGVLSLGMAWLVRNCIN